MKQSVALLLIDPGFNFLGVTRLKTGRTGMPAGKVEANEKFRGNFKNYRI